MTRGEKREAGTGIKSGDIWMKKELMSAAFRTILDDAAEMIFLKDVNLVYQAVSAPFVEMVGKSSAGEVVGYTDAEIYEDRNLCRRYEADERRLLSEQKDMRGYIEPITDDNGQARYGSTSKYLLRDEKGQVIGVLGIVKDVTREYRARQRYQQEFRYLFELPEDTYAVCYIDVDDWRIIKQRRQNIEDGTLQECQTVEEICRYAEESIVDDQCEGAKFYRDFTAAKLWGIYTSGRSSVSYEYERKLSDGSTRWVYNEAHFLMDVDSGHLCVMLSVKDISADKQEERRLFEAVTTDQMTKVLNRETAMKYIRQILHDEEEELHVLFMLDVDNFKGINDMFGHQAGDEFLIRLAGDLKNSFRENDVVGRIGGDEFFIFLRNVVDIDQIEKKAQEILDIVSRAGEVYPEAESSGSIGIALYPGDGRTVEELYARADEALYVAKRGGKNQYVFAK